MSTDAAPGGSNPDTGRAMPPYEGRRESADVDDSSESVQDDAKVAGATGPVADDEPKASEPSETPGGAVASPADEQPAEDMPETASSDEGVGPAHVAGVSRGEDFSEPG